jgi:hypothetical protein
MNRFRLLKLDELVKKKRTMGEKRYEAFKENIASRKKPVLVLLKGLENIEYNYEEIHNIPEQYMGLDGTIVELLEHSNHGFTQKITLRTLLSRYQFTNGYDEKLENIR